MATSLDKAAQAGGPAPKNTKTEWRHVGGGSYGQVDAAVNLWELGGAAKISVASDAVAAVAVALPENGGAVSILCGGGKTRYAIGDDSVAATQNSHAINNGERLEFVVRQAETHISIICDTGVANGALDITGLGRPDA